MLKRGFEAAQYSLVYRHIQAHEGKTVIDIYK